MTTQNSTTPHLLNPNHPHSGLVDKANTQATLFNVTNVMTALLESGFFDDKGCEQMGVKLMFQECLKAVGFEAYRIGETKQEVAQ